MESIDLDEVSSCEINRIKTRGVNIVLLTSEDYGVDRLFVSKTLEKTERRIKERRYKKISIITNAMCFCAIKG